MYSFHSSPFSVQPPPILSLHLVRSEYTPYGQVVKKTPYVNFPMILDMTEFMTDERQDWGKEGGMGGNEKSEDEAGMGGKWSQAKGKGRERSNQDNDGETQSSSASPSQPPANKVLYRLNGLICHYGYTSSFGHFVCYRRKPTSVSGSDRVRKSCPDGCACNECEYYGQVRTIVKEDYEEDDLDVETRRGGAGNSSTRKTKKASGGGGGYIPGKGWLRISDADVEEVDESRVLSEKGTVFMLFYEKVEEYVDDGTEERFKEGKVDHSVERVKGLKESVKDQLGSTGVDWSGVVDREVVKSNISLDELN